MLAKLFKHKICKKERIQYFCIRSFLDLRHHKYNLLFINLELNTVKLFQIIITIALQTILNEAFFLFYFLVNLGLLSLQILT